MYRDRFPCEFERESGKNEHTHTRVVSVRRTMLHTYITQLIFSNSPILTHTQSHSHAHIHTHIRIHTLRDASTISNGSLFSCIK